LLNDAVQIFPVQAELKLCCFHILRCQTVVTKRAVCVDGSWEAKKAV